ncbi:hypothetical protein DL95DRAFT_477266 [Leptodontidium sp. 2 PMI_412]|nr:hypothetical protein DL95DRAFT_477266 [Leptodontidium sp. 2 PMI_412]
MGRGVNHYAAMQSLENLQQIVSSGVDVDARDTMARNAMHWAVISGSLDVVERVLSLSRRLLDQPDNDGWTPHLGADPLVKCKGLDREWTLIQVARYYNIDDEAVELLVKKSKEKLGKEELYIEAEHAYLKASEQVGSCDSCHCQMLGNRYKCDDCLDFDFCYKCYKSCLVMHNRDHTFNVIGPEFPVVVKVKKESTEDNDDDTDDATDDDTDDDENETSKS